MTRRAVLRTGLVGHEVIAGPACDRVDFARIEHAAAVFFTDCGSDFRTGYFWADVSHDGNLEIGSRLTPGEVLALR